jgi:hypothetical protein
LLLAFALRTIGLDQLRLSGDSSWSVYIALRDLQALTYTTAVDSHPPLYYYLLHFWVLVAGKTELSIRLLSVITGLLTVALVYKLGQKLFGPGGGLLAGALAAISPFLVYFDRMPRMYSLLAFQTALALYFLFRLMERPRGYQQGLYLLTILAALYTHYAALLLSASGFLALLLCRRVRGRGTWSWLAGHAAVLALFSPWLLYALGPSIRATAQEYATTGLPPPPNLVLLLERFWVALNLGNMGDSGQARFLALVFALLGGLGLGLLATQRRRLPDPRTWALVLTIAFPLAVVAVAYQVAGYVAFTRFLLFATPAYLVLLAGLLLAWRRWPWLVVAVPVSFTVAAMAYTLAGTFYVERHLADPGSIMVTERLRPLAGPQDAVIFQAQWHIGYFLVHYGEGTPAVYAMRELTPGQMSRLLREHPKVWLAMYNARKRDPAYPLEEWLDSHAYKADEVWEGRTRLALYSAQGDSALRPAKASFGGQIELEAAGVSPQRVRPGQVLQLSLRWRAQRDIGQKYVVFVHLVDEAGRGCRGRDSEPLDGLRPTETWRAGEVVLDRRGLLVRPGTPPGHYYLEVGLYQRGDWTKRLLLDNGGGDRVRLGPIEVVGALPPVPYQGSLRQLGRGVELLGYQVGPVPGGEAVRSVSTVDGPVSLYLPFAAQAGEQVQIKTYWKAARPPTEGYLLGLHLVDGTSTVWGKASAGPLGGACPTFRWKEGEVVADVRSLHLSPDTPAGTHVLQAILYSPGGQPLGDPVSFGSLRVGRPGD